MNIKLIFVILVAIAVSFSTTFAAVAPAPEPKVSWVSGGYGVRSMSVGDTCWGDAIGPYAGPVVVKATAKTPSWGMVNAACALEPTISVWSRLEWAKIKYKEGRSWWGVSSNGVFTPTPTPVPTTVVTGAPSNLWFSGHRQVKNRSMAPGTACWGPLVRVGSTNHYNKIVRLNKSANVLIASGYCSTYSTGLAGWIFKSTGKGLAVVNGN